MVKLRSREPRVSEKPRPKRFGIEPETPTRTHESCVHRSPREPVPGGSGSVDGPTTTARRRSLRLASKSNGNECINGSAEQKDSNAVGRKGTNGKRRLNVDDDPVSVVEVEESKGFLSLRSGKRVAKRVQKTGSCSLKNRCEQMEIESRGSEGLKIEYEKLDSEKESRSVDVSEMVGEKMKGKEVVSVDVSDVTMREIDSVEDGSVLKANLNIEARLDTEDRKSGSAKGRKRASGDLKEEILVNDKSESKCVTELCGDSKVESHVHSTCGTDGRVTRNDKGKAVMLDGNGNEDDDVAGEGVMETHSEVSSVENELLNHEKEMEGRIVQEDIGNVDKPSSSRGRRRYTREEKGKNILVQNSSTPDSNRTSGIDEEMEIKNSISEDRAPDVLGTDVNTAGNVEQTMNTTRTEQFHEIAKKNAARFAFFDAKEDEEEEISDMEVEQTADEEDWPGPFSTAMKIMKDRKENTDIQIRRTADSNKAESLQMTWLPKRDESFIPRKLSPPSLQDLCMKVLAKNADAIASLDYVPDALRHKLCRLLCDSRRMNVHFLDLLVRGSPAGIRLSDCSWITEDEFTECFKKCETSNLRVLQLDQCGRCLPDYILHCTLARSPNNLPVLSSLSVNGACRLSDAGLRALVSAAPSIQSLNISQCSLLTSSSIDILPDSLGSVLKELYISDCEGIDPKLIVPALIKLEKLEVLSVAGLSSVRDRFVRDVVTSRGQNLKGLILADCVKLTDSSVKAISENCPGLCVLDLSNLLKLTDVALGYLANGCQAMEKFLLCRNSFSDEAVAVFLETAGSSLTELSLNNVKKVGNSTALALAKHAKKLQTLDLSWCREMTDHALGCIVDHSLSLTSLKLFGCTQVSNVFLEGHSNPNVKIIGLKMSPIFDHLKVPNHWEAW